MTDRTWKLIEQGMKDIKQWIADAPTPEARTYREQTAANVLLSKEDMHYYRDGLDNQIVVGNWAPDESYNFQPINEIVKQINEKWKMPDEHKHH